LKKMLLSALLAALLIPAVAAASTTADPSAGLTFGYKGSGGLRFIVYYVQVSSHTDGVSGPGGSVVITDCRAGQGLPLGPEPVSGTASSGKVFVNKRADIQWDFDSVPPQDGKPFQLKLVYATPKHSLPFSVCVKASAVQDSSGIRWSYEMRMPLRATK
jgi:hypothetical protein